MEFLNIRKIITTVFTPLILFILAIVSLISIFAYTSVSYTQAGASVSVCGEGQFAKITSEGLRCHDLGINIESFLATAVPCGSGEVYRSIVAGKIVCSEFTVTSDSHTHGVSPLWELSGDNVVTKNRKNIKTAGTIYANNFIYSSDINKKKNIVPIKDGLEKVLSLNGYTFTFKKSDKKSIGFIAQEVEKIFPNLVVGKDGGKGVDYASITAALVEAVKEQQIQIEELKKEVEILKLNK